MRGFREVLSVAVVGAALLGGFLPTEAHADAAAVRGRFVRLAEKQVGEREYLAVVVQPGEGKEEVMLLMPRGSEQAAQARKLRKGQLVEIAYGSEAGHKWVRRIEAAGAKERPGAEVLRGQFAKLAEKQLGEREYLVIVLEPGEGKEEVMLLMPRGSEQAARARKLSKGQQVVIAYGVEAGQKWVRRIEVAGAKERPRGEVLRGRFAKLAEKQLGEREYLAVVVQPAKGKEQVVLLMPRGSEQAAQARKLRKGQLVEIAYVTEAGQKWLKRLRAGSEAAQLQEQIRKLQQRLEQMERELKLLREENALLKKALQARKAANSPAEE